MLPLDRTRRPKNFVSPYFSFKRPKTLQRLVLASSYITQHNISGGKTLKDRNQVPKRDSG